MAADQRIAAVDRDDLGVVPGVAVTILGDRAGPEGRDVHLQPRRVDPVGQLLEEGGDIDVVRRVLADDDTHRHGPAAPRQRLQRRAERRHERSVRGGLQQRDVNPPLRRRDQVVHLPHQAVRMAGRELARPAAPQDRRLHDPVAIEPVADGEIVSDAGVGAGRVALRQLGAQLLEQRHARRRIGRPDAAVADHRRDGGRVGQRAGVVSGEMARNGAVGQVAAARCEHDCRQAERREDPEAKRHGQ